MRVDQAPNTFKPVTITLESQDEVQALRALILMGKIQSETPTTILFAGQLIADLGRAYS